MEISEKMKDRFFKKVNKTDGCWLWESALDKDGYGRFLIEGRRIPSHRISWFILGRDIPADKPLLRHKCRSRHCVNPDHLEVGTHIENMADKIRDGTHICGENSPTAKLTNQQVIEIRQRYAKKERVCKLACEFSVSPRAISFIVHGHSWKHLL